MKKKISILVVSVSLFFLNSCVDKNKTGSPKVETPPVNSVKIVEKTEPLQIEMCYLKTFNKDSTMVSLQMNGDEISGKMNIKPFQKDKSTGTLSGKKLQNGDFDLVYTYMIEGMNQTETKIMKIEYDKLYIKVGEMVDEKKDGNLKYKDVSKAEFKDILYKVDCK